MPVPDAAPPSLFAADLATMTALEAISRKTPNLPELATLAFSADGVSATPWLFCRPATALLMWVKALPGEVAIKPVLIDAETGTQLVAVGHVEGRAITLQVVTHMTDVAVDSTGFISRNALAQISARETGAPDLGELLDMETIRVPNAPMPPVEEEAQTAASVS